LKVYQILQTRYGIYLAMPYICVFKANPASLMVLAAKSIFYRLLFLRSGKIC
jgi:hypothetical protein